MAAFLARLEALFVSRGDGSVQTSVEDLSALVRAEPERMVAACLAYAGMATTRQGTWHAYAQTALVIAGVYEVEQGDDALTEQVREQFAEAGLQVRDPVITGVPEAQPVVIDVTAQMLAEQDVYPFVLAFSHQGADHDRLDRLRSLKSRLRFTFGVPVSDPRWVWEVPEVRQYVAQLNRTMPYLPYFFDPDPELRLLGIWICCLAPMGSLRDGGLAAGDDEVLAQVALTGRLVRLFAELLGEDGEGCSRAVLGAVFPATYVDYVLDLARQLDSGAG